MLHLLKEGLSHRSSPLLNFLVISSQNIYFSKVVSNFSMFDCSCCSKIIKSMAYGTAPQNNALEKSALLSLVNLPAEQLYCSAELLLQ